MSALFNVSPLEILVVLVLGVVCIGMLAGLVVLIVFLTRRKDEPRND